MLEEKKNISLVRNAVKTTPSVLTNGEKSNRNKIRLTAENLAFLPLAKGRLIWTKRI